MTDKVKVGDIYVTPENKQVLWTGQAWIDAGGRDAIPFLRESASLNPSALASVGRGMLDISQGAQQLVGALSPEDEARIRQDRELFDRGATGVDQGFRIGGQIAATAPLGGIAGIGRGLIGRTVAGAGTGGSAGALMFADKQGDRATNTVLGTVGGGVGGAVAEPLLRGIGRLTGESLKGFRRVWLTLSGSARQNIDDRVTQSLRAAGVDPASLDSTLRQSLRNQVLRATAAGDDLGDEALARGARAQAAGFTDDAAPTRGQLTRLGTDFGDERNMAKLEGGEELQARFLAQERRFGEQLDELRPAARVGDRFEAGELAEQAIKRRAEQLQEGVRDAYKTARASYGDGAELSHDAFVSRMSGVLKDFEDATPGEVKARILQIANGPRDLNPLELEKLDKLITGSIGPVATGNQKTAATVLKRELVRIWGDSGYAEAKRLASERFRALGANQQSTANRLLSGRLEPDQVVNRLETGPLRDLVKLRSLIGNEPEWEQLGDAVIQKLISKSYRAGGDTGSGVFLPGQFSRAVENMGSRRLEIIFGKERGGQLMRLSKVAHDLFTEPSMSTANRSNTAITQARGLMSMLRSLIDSALPGRLSLPSGGASVAPAQVGRALQPGSGAAAGTLSESAIRRGGSLAPAASGVGLTALIAGNANGSR